MQFCLLGPLTATHDGRIIALGGMKQRATLGYLLLRANHVVPTSQLVAALWPDDEAPASARKILQNSVWALRTVLSRRVPPSARVSLSTQAPGYMLEVDPELIDLQRFHRMAEQGRDELSTGSAEEGARTLREALGMWRGRALADLVEGGLVWPELTSLEQTRLDIMEDYFDAELACGRHQAILGELAALVETEVLRERACGQLMIALYRCGRHADALSVYARARAALVNDLGLEPGPSLQRLQHAVLTHDPELDLLPARRIDVVSAPVPPIAAPEHGWDVSLATAVPPATPASAPAAPTTVAPVTAPDRQRLSVVIIAVRRAASGCDESPDEADNVLASVTSMVKAAVEHSEGSIVASIGSTILALFGLGHPRPDEAVRAVGTAQLVRDLFSTSTTAIPGSVRFATSLVVSAAVVTGEAAVEPGDPSTIGHGLVDRCRQLLALTAEGEVWICDNTHRLVSDAVACREVDPSAGIWRLVSPHRRRQAAPSAFSHHELELSLLDSLLTGVLRRSRPQLVTVLGEAGAPVSWLMAEFHYRVSGQNSEVIVLRGGVPSSATAGPLAAHRQIINSLCGIQLSDRPSTAHAKLGATVHEVCHDEREARRLYADLVPILELDQTNGERILDLACALAVWERLVWLTAQRRPVVLIIDDLHHAEDPVLDSVERLAEAPDAIPLLIVVTSRMPILDRRPRWGGGHPHATVITLESKLATVQRRLQRFISRPQALAGADLAGSRRNGIARDDEAQILP